MTLPHSSTLPFSHSSRWLSRLEGRVLAAERETGRTVGSFNIDNGELKSIEFVDFCASRGIKPRWTAPFTSAQNGRVEHFHYTQFTPTNDASRLQIYLPTDGMNLS